MALIARERRIDSSIDLTPLIDVVFQLLIFLMVSSQFTKPEALVELPKTPGEAARVDPKREKLSIVIHEDGNVSLNGEVVMLDELGAKIQKLVQASGIKRAEVRGDRLSHFGIFVLVMEAAQSHGVESLAIVKKREEANELP